MKKPVIPADHKYSAGVISQQCPSCDWQDKRLKQEKNECPNCGAKPRPPKLNFGGMEIINRHTGESAIIQEADLPDTIVFMLKNSTFWLDEDIETEEDGIHAEKVRRERVKRMMKKFTRHLYLVKK